MAISFPGNPGLDEIYTYNGMDLRFGMVLSGPLVVRRVTMLCI